jgi:hypothetical protein
VKKYVKNRRRTRRGGMFTSSKEERIDNEKEDFNTRKTDTIISMFESGNKVLFDELKEKMILAIDLLIICKKECLTNCNKPCSEENCKEKEDLCKDIRTITNKKPNYAAPNFCNTYLENSISCRDYLRLLQRLINYREAYKKAPRVSDSFEKLKTELDFFSNSVKDLPLEFSLEEKKKSIEDLQYHESPWRDVSTAES